MALGSAEKGVLTKMVCVCLKSEKEESRTRALTSLVEAATAFLAFASAPLRRFWLPIVGIVM